MKTNSYFKTIATCCFCSLMYITNVAAQDEDPFAGGKGTTRDPYLVETPDQFDAIRSYRSAKFKMIADLDFANYVREDGEAWWPIGEWGSGDNDVARFSGTFDGDGHTIKNLSVTKVAHDLSIFGVTSNAKIVNLVVENCRIEGEGRLGVLTGAAFNTTIDQVAFINCECLNTLSDHGSHAGGITGPATGCHITNCYTMGGRVYGKDGVGGISSFCESSTAISNCYSTCAIEGYTNVGGISGGANNGNIMNCVAINTEIISTDPVVTGRVAGKAFSDGPYVNNYALSDLMVNGAIVTENIGASTMNGANATAEELSSQSFYADVLNFAFVPDDENPQVWKLDPAISKYPVFVWQNSLGTGVNDQMVDTNTYKIATTAEGLEISGLNGNETIWVYNMAGMLIEQAVVNNSTKVITLGQNGTYIVKIVSKELVKTQKVIK